MHACLQTTDILSEVFQQLACSDVSASTSTTLADLRHATLVCRSWRDEAQRQLNSHLEFDDDMNYDLEAVMKKWLSVEKIHPLARSIQVYFEAGRRRKDSTTATDEAIGALLLQILGKSTNLESLTLRAVGYPPVIPWDFLRAASLQNHKYLSILPVQLLSTSNEHPAAPFPFQLHSLRMRCVNSIPNTMATSILVDLLPACRSSLREMSIGGTPAFLTFMSTFIAQLEGKANPSPLQMLEVWILPGCQKLNLSPLTSTKIKTFRIQAESGEGPNVDLQHIIDSLPHRGGHLVELDLSINYSKMGMAVTEAWKGLREKILALVATGSERRPFGKLQRLWLGKFYHREKEGLSNPEWEKFRKALEAHGIELCFGFC
ncbi:hypothetical protein T439DRAFT_380461 [Meredithblackwellia eburnea MCA 4105]